MKTACLLSMLLLAGPALDDQDPPDTANGGEGGCGCNWVDPVPDTGDAEP